MHTYACKHTHTASHKHPNMCNVVYISRGRTAENIQAKHRRTYTRTKNIAYIDSHTDMIVAHTHTHTHRHILTPLLGEEWMKTQASTLHSWKHKLIVGSRERMNRQTYLWHTHKHIHTHLFLRSENWALSVSLCHSSPLLVSPYSRFTCEDHIAQGHVTFTTHTHIIGLISCRAHKYI